MVIIELIGWFYVPSNEVEAQFWFSDGYGAILHASLPVYWLLVAMRGLVLIGLLSLHPTARILFLVLTVVSIALSLFWGYRVTAPIEGPFLFLATIVDGIIIGLAYYSPVSREFSKAAP